MEAAPANARSETTLRDTLEDVKAMLERHRVLDLLAQRQDTPNKTLVEQLQHRQNLVELRRRVRALHPADFAYVLESLPTDDRMLLWSETDAMHAAEVLIELDDAARASLVNATDPSRLIDIAKRLDVYDLAWLSDALPEDVMHEVSAQLGSGEQSLLEQAISYPEHSVGPLMTPDVASVTESQTVSEVLGRLRERGELPADVDRLFVTDARHVLRGAISLHALILSRPDQRMSELMQTDPLSFRPEDTAATAARAFDRYDLVSAPVVTDRGKLVGRLSVAAVMDFVRVTADADALAMAGLRGGEDLFASVWESARNRSPWLFVNLITAFVASRFIGFFESTIQQLVALATLMPVVASIGGNTGNQTIALVIRGLAFDQLPPESTRHLLRKEFVVSLLNGVMWGGLVGIFAALVYHHAALGLVMAGAVVLNLVIAAMAGVTVPLVLQRIGRDPAQGASVLLTFVTDSMGFFLFLGLAKVFL